MVLGGRRPAIVVDGLGDIGLDGGEVVVLGADAALEFPDCGGTGIAGLTLDVIGDGGLGAWCLFTTYGKSSALLSSRKEVCSLMRLEGMKGKKVKYQGVVYRQVGNVDDLCGFCDS